MHRDELEGKKRKALVKEKKQIACVKESRTEKI